MQHQDSFAENRIIKIVYNGSNDDCVQEHCHTARLQEHYTTLNMHNILTGLRHLLYHWTNDQSHCQVPGLDDGHISLVLVTQAIRRT